MLLIVLIGIAAWSLIVVGVLALCVQAGRADRLEASPQQLSMTPPVHAAARRHVTARSRRPLRPVA